MLFKFQIHKNTLFKIQIHKKWFLSEAFTDIIKSNRRLAARWSGQKNVSHSTFDYTNQSLISCSPNKTSLICWPRNPCERQAWVPFSYKLFSIFLIYLCFSFTLYYSNQYLKCSIMLLIQSPVLIYWQIHAINFIKNIICCFYCSCQYWCINLIKFKFRIFDKLCTLFSLFDTICW